MRTFIFLSIFLSYMALTPILLFPYLLMLPFSRLKAQTYVVFLIRLGVMVICKATQIRIVVQGWENFPKDPYKPTMFVANHQSAWDIAALLGISPRPIGFIAKKELFWAFPMSLWMMTIGCLFIDRKNVRAAMVTMNQALEGLKQGKFMGVFPEGGRSRGGDMKPFKRGSFKPIFRAEAAILPIAISGSYKSWEEKGSSIQSAVIYVHFHPVIETKGLNEEEREALPDKVWEEIHTDLERLKSLPEVPVSKIKGGIFYE
jgi:1-acyl-sn-glycerol-3-phosphate acyltransferase